MPESGNPVQQSTTIRPYRGAGGVFKDQRRPILDWKESTALPRVRVERVEREVSFGPPQSLFELQLPIFPRSAASPNARRNQPQDSSLYQP